MSTLARVSAPGRTLAEETTLRIGPIDRIRATYGQIPEVSCRGLCADRCGHVPMSDAERTYIRAVHGIDIPPTADPCPALDPQGRCRVYRDRPTICRLYGTTTGGPLACEHGCIGARPMTHRDALRALTDTLLAAGEWTPAQVRRIRALIDDPDAANLAHRAAAGGDIATHELYRYLEGVLGGQVSIRYAMRAAEGWAALQRTLGDPDAN